MTVFSPRDRKQPLSLSFLHKPSRATNELEKATTRHNSLINRFVNEVAPTPTPPVSPSSSCPSASPPYSPQSEPSSPQPSGPPSPPRLVRKKSGEVVKPVIRESSVHRRARSLPSTPTFKQVHFGIDTDVKYFHQRDRPSAISNPNSPDAPQSDSELESDVELPNWSLDASGDTSYPRPSQWSISLLNFPHLSYTKCIAHKRPVFLERVFLQHDTVSLVGHVAVRNLAFEKTVTVRYSLDNWLTIIELPATYSDVRPDILKRNNYDRFVFDIPLEKLFSSFYINRSASVGAHERTYEFCLKYVAHGVEYWDNNEFANYKLTLHRRPPANPNQLRHPTVAKHVLNGHNAKPRYSQSYLKRRTSDSHPPQPKRQQDCDNKSLDFESNQYFMSSPMLSLYKHDAPVRGDTASPMPDIELSKQLAVNQSLDEGQSSAGANPDSEQGAPSQLDSQSYKELLENYCFFRGNDEQPEEHKPEGHKPFTVHAFLHS